MFGCLGLLLDHGVQGQLLDLAVLQELLLAVAGGVGGALRGEDDVEALDILAHGELLGRLRTLARDADLERAEAVQLHALGVLHLVAHDLDHFLDDGHHVGALDGTVALDDFRQLAGVDDGGGHGAGVPLAAALRSGRLVLM